MAERKPVIPERQLLDLIQNPSTATQAVEAQKKERSLRGLFSWSALKGRWAFAAEKMAKRRKNPFHLRAVNFLLNICIAVLFVYFVGQFVMAMQSAGRVPDFPRVPSKLSQGTDGDQAPGVADYTDKPHARDIFKFGQVPKPKVVQQEIAPEEVFDPSEENPLDGEFSLVGISYSDEPDVMIKDDKTEEVFFLKRGDWLQDEIKVQAIYKDRVILSYKGKEIELR